MLLMLFALSSCLVAPKANVARHKADNHVLNHIVPDVLEPETKRTEQRKKGSRGWNLVPRGEKGERKPLRMRAIRHRVVVGVESGSGM